MAAVAKVLNPWKNASRLQEVVCLINFCSFFLGQSLIEMFVKVSVKRFFHSVNLISTSIFDSKNVDHTTKRIASFTRTFIAMSFSLWLNLTWCRSRWQRVQIIIFYVLMPCLKFFWRYSPIDYLIFSTLPGFKIKFSRLLGSNEIRNLKGLPPSSIVAWSGTILPSADRR